MRLTPLVLAATVKQGHDALTHIGVARGRTNVKFLSLMKTLDCCVTGSIKRSSFANNCKGLE